VNRRRASPELLQADLTDLVVNRPATDRSGYYMATEGPSLQTDLVAAGAGTGPRRRKRPESYSKPALRSYES
jgi:hypothetical protein